MAVMVNTGDLKRKIVFKQPTSSLNDEGGREVSYADYLTTWAKVDRFNQRRVTEAQAVALVGALDFTIRWAEDREQITEDWLITYKGEDYIIHLIDPISEDQRFIRFTGKSKGLAIASNGQSAEPGTTDVDLSNLLLTFTVPTALDVTVVVVKTDALQDTLIDWGDGTQVTVLSTDPISEAHSYGPGEWECRVYPVSTISDPEAQSVNKLQSVIVLKSSGDGTMAIGESLSYAEFLRVLEADGLGMDELPELPNTGADQVRRVVVSDNELTGQELSDLLSELDAINWPVGYVDYTGNPGAGSLTGAGLLARQNLVNKGWTVNG